MSAFSLLSPRRICFIFLYCVLKRPSYSFKSLIPLLVLLHKRDRQNRFLAAYRSRHISSLTSLRPLFPAMSPTEKHRPPPLSVCNDKEKSDMILRIVSPIAPQFVSHDLRHTLRLSESIRNQQNNLIASGHYEKSLASSDSNSSASLMLNGSSGGLDSNTTPSHTATEGSSVEREAEPRSSLSWAGKSDTDHDLAKKPDVPIIEVDSEEVKDHQMQGASPNSGGTYYSDSSEFNRIANAMSRKKLKRDNPPGDLKLLPSRLNNVRQTPLIRSAPLRPSTTAAPYGMQRWVPVRYVYPPLPPMPHSAMQYVHTPSRRSMPGHQERRASRVRLPPRNSLVRRKPVLDVFQGDAVKFAPLPSQPPSAQLETFDEKHDDNEEATEEEIQEMETKRKMANPVLKGSICFNDTSAFNFKIFKGNELLAKEKFLKICETTWNEYVAGT